MIASCAPVGPALVDDALAAWSAAIDGMAGYWAGAVQRRAVPHAIAHDAWRWWTAAAVRQRPRWTLPNRIVLETDIARVRDFSQGSRAAVLPTLVLPPQAGHDSCIVDYSPEQSQIGVIQGAGLKRVFSFDWKGATHATRDASIEDYLDVIDQAVERLGGRVNLVGDCQGGWLATLWAALRPDAVHTLTIAGAPVDFHAGEPAIHKWVQTCTPGGSLALYRALVASGGGVLKGEHLLNGFLAIGPQNEVARHVQLLANIHDADHVARYREFEDWFKHTQDIPGRLYLWIVEHLFRDNALIGGDLVVAGERVDLRRIECPLFLLGGARDHVTPPPQVFALAEHAGTAPARVTRRVASGGHLGLFMGREALERHWTPLMQQIAQLSRRRPRRRPVKES